MSLQVGIDLIEVERIEESIAEHGGRFLGRVYTDAERADSSGDPSRLAARFAAKEATMKALRTLDDGLGWQTIEVLGDGGGGHRIRLSGPAAALAAARGVGRLSVSLSEHRRQAGAVVIAEADR